MADTTFTRKTGTIAHSGDVDGIGANETIIYTCPAGRTAKVFFEIGSSSVGKDGFLSSPATAASQAIINTVAVPAAADTLLASNKIQGGDDLSSAFLFIGQASILAAYDNGITNWSAVVGGPVIPAATTVFNEQESTIKVCNLNVATVNTGTANVPTLTEGDTISFSSNLITGTAVSFANCAYNFKLMEQDIVL